MKLRSQSNGNGESDNLQAHGGIGRRGDKGGEGPGGVKAAAGNKANKPEKGDAKIGSTTRGRGGSGGGISGAGPSTRARSRDQHMDEVVDLNQENVPPEVAAVAGEGRPRRNRSAPVRFVPEMPNQAPVKKGKGKKKKPAVKSVGGGRGKRSSKSGEELHVKFSQDVLVRYIPARGAEGESDEDDE